MVDRLLTGLTDAWNAALDDRLALADRSPVAALDRPLVARRLEVGE